MPNDSVRDWPERIRQRYENYLRTSFYFMDPRLRASFRDALRSEEALLTGPFPEEGHGFRTSQDARTIADECFPSQGRELHPALLSKALYVHQERAIRTTHISGNNIVVATGTASGKTESFLYPILFELYQQYLDGRLDEPGVRALILYPMNALANDQRERLGEICNDLRHAESNSRRRLGNTSGRPRRIRETPFAMPPLDSKNDLAPPNLCSARRCGRRRRTFSSQTTQCLNTS